jgi:hypothetical protein
MKAAGLSGKTYEKAKQPPRVFRSGISSRGFGPTYGGLLCTV